MVKTNRVRAMLLSGLFLGLAACTSSSLKPHTYTQTSADLKSFKSMHFQHLAGVDGEIHLINGAWQDVPEEEGGESIAKVQLLSDIVLSGDLDGDNIPEKVVFLYSTGGGSGAYTNAAVVKVENKVFTNIASSLLGDRIQLLSAKIENQKLIVDLVQVGEDDPACCAGERATQMWELSDDHFVQMPNENEGIRAKIDILSEHHWQLISWQNNEALAKDIVISLEYKSGRFTGFAACNRYFADVKAGDAFGDLQVLMPGSTKMACDEERMKAEHRYLSLLSKSTNFRLLAGKLYFSYLNGDSFVEHLVFKVVDKAP